MEAFQGAGCSDILGNSLLALGYEIARGRVRTRVRGNPAKEYASDEEGVEDRHFVAL